MTTVKLLLAALLVATAALPAAADPPAAQADALLKRGRELMGAGQLPAACAAFAESQRLDPAPTTQLALGVCREKTGQLATAWRLYREVARELAGATDPAGRQVAQAALADAAKLEPRLSMLTIHVAQPTPGLALRRGDDALDPAAWNTPAPIDGGTYTLSASAPGYAAWSAAVTITAERDAKTVEVPMLVATPGVAAAGSAAEPAAEAPPHRARALPLGLGVGGLVVGGVGIALELSAESAYTAAKVAPTDAARTAGWHSANDRRYVAEGLGLAGLAALGAAAYLYLRPLHAEGRGLALVPLATGDRGGLALVGSY